MREMLGRYCLAKLDQMIRVVEEMDGPTANTEPTFTGANSPYQILAHCVGMLRRWTQHEVLGREVVRDREAEFASQGSVPELVALAQAARDEFAADLAILPDLPVMPVPHDGERFWAETTDGVLAHVFEELCQHLGHLEITRDLIAARRA